MNGPLFKAIKMEKSKVIVTFDYDEGLYFKDKKADLFEVAGADNVFYKATAVIKNNSVIVQSDKVKSPTKVRYAWKNTDQATLFNQANLPASTFISE